MNATAPGITYQAQESDSFFAITENYARVYGIATASMAFRLVSSGRRS